jgi:cytochrome d ubiquinol oxidase subunit II
MWDMGFALGSILPALLFGVAVGNILRGLPLDEKMRFAGSFLGLLNPYALLVGVLGLAMFATHGALYLALKTDGELAARAKSWAQKAQGLYLELFIFASIVTMIIHPQLWKNYIRFPVLWIIPVLTLGAIVLIGVLSKRDQTLKAFICSGLSIAGLMGMCGAGLFPNLVPALNNPAWSLTIWNASSSALTLKTMLILALIGMPIVIAYTIWIYIIFRGKVKVEAAGY